YYQQPPQAQQAPSQGYYPPQAQAQPAQPYYPPQPQAQPQAQPPQHYYPQQPQPQAPPPGYYPMPSEPGRKLNLPVWLMTVISAGLSTAAMGAGPLPSEPRLVESSETMPKTTPTMPTAKTTVISHTGRLSLRPGSLGIG